MRTSSARLPHTRHNVTLHHIRGTVFRPLRDRWDRPEGETCRDPSKLPLIIRESTWVKFADRYAQLRQEGLYQFWDFGKLKYTRDDETPAWVDTRQRYTCVILFRNDILALLSALACIQLHGPRMDHEPHAKRVERAKTGILSLTCGPVTEFTLTILKELGWQGRPISLKRIQGPYNLWDDGHVLFEFYWPKLRKWVLADVDNHWLFMKGGRYLHAGEVAELIRNRKNYDLVSMTPKGMSTVDLSDGVVGDMPVSFVAEPVRGDPAEMKKRINLYFVMPRIAEGGYYYFYHSSAAVRSRILRSHGQQGDIKAISKEAWWRKFYDSAPPR